MEHNKGGIMKIEEIKNIINVKIINGKDTINIEKFNVSCRNHEKGEFYLPIFWREDRHTYIIDAVKKGAIGYMISSSCKDYESIIKESIKINPNISILQVENVNDAIYQLALYQRNKYIHIPMIAVTGSVGKTSTCEMISNVIKQEKKVLSDNGNNNTKPLLSWLMLDFEDYEAAVLEAGIGKKDVMEPISKLLQPAIVVINNIGTAHIESFGSKEEILKEKVLLTKHMVDNKIVFLNQDDILLKDLKLDGKYRVVKYSAEEANHVRLENGVIGFDITLYGKNTHFCIHSYSRHDVSNAICAIRIGELLNIDKNNIINGLKEYKNVKRRFQVIRQNGYTIIDDTYNASLASMKSGLISANNIKGCKRRIAILGQMLELGNYSEPLHREVGEVFKEITFDVLLTQGEDTQYICQEAKKYMPNKKVIHYKKQDELVNQLLKEMKQGDLIYLKASKKIKFDQIVQQILEKIDNCKS